MLDADEQKVIDDVARYGWHDIGIEGDGEGPNFNYTVGLMQTHDHPEVIIFGLKTTLMHDVLWSIVHDIENGRKFVKQGVYDDVLEGLPCHFRPVHESQHTLYLGYAMWHCRHGGAAGTLKAMQCFWPDKDGKFPWEPDCHPDVSAFQPLLYEQA